MPLQHLIFCLVLRKENENFHNVGFYLVALNDQFFFVQSLRQLIKSIAIINEVVKLNPFN